MAVRFLPPPEEHPSSPREERGDLAEVIEFRSRLRRPEPAAADSDADAEDRADAGGRAGAEFTSHAGSSREPASIAERAAQRKPGSGWAAGPGSGADDVPEAGDDPLDEAVDDGPTAYETAVKLLARRALSSGELQRALVAAGHPELDAEEAVATCVQALYLDDTDLAVTVATKLRESKGESQARIRQKLRERHLPAEAIEAALAGLDDDTELELLNQTARDRAKRLVGLDRATAERRLLGFLARRGWGGERATRATRDALDGVARETGSRRGSVRFS